MNYIFVATEKTLRINEWKTRIICTRF